MKTSTIALSAALALAVGAAGFAPQAAYAVQSASSDGTITFNGLVVANSCTIDIDGQGGSPTIVLPTVYTTALATAGATTGDTQFTIALDNCDVNLSDVTAVFSGSGIDATTGYLTNTATSNNVEVQLLNDASQVMDLSQTTAAGQQSSSAAFASQGASLVYTARYVASGGAASSGLVTSTVQYTLIYN